MREIIRKDEKFEREVWSRDKAIAYFKSIGEHYKAEIIQDLPASEEMMSPLSVEYCRRARNHLVALGSPFAIAHPPASIADAPEKAPPKPALNSPGGVTLNLSQPLIPRVGGLGGGGLFRFRVALR